MLKAKHCRFENWFEVQIEHMCTPNLSLYIPHSQFRACRATPTWAMRPAPTWMSAPTLPSTHAARTPSAPTPRAATRERVVCGLL